MNTTKSEGSIKRHMWTPHLKKWGINWPPGPRGSAAPAVDWTE